MITDHQFPGDDLNEAITIEHDERNPENGNASHHYEVRLRNENGHRKTVAEMRFQDGPRNEEGSTPGCTDAALLAILIDRYRGFQGGEFACRENAVALTKMEEALMWMQKRVADRIRRGVLGEREK